MKKYFLITFIFLISACGGSSLPTQTSVNPPTPSVSVTQETPANDVPQPPPGIVERTWQGVTQKAEKVFNQVTDFFSSSPQPEKIPTGLGNDKGLTEGIYDPCRQGQTTACPPPNLDQEDEEDVRKSSLPPDPSISKFNVRRP